MDRALAAACSAGVESLENRLLFAVARDPAGWTVVTPSSDPAVSRIVYVSSSSGNDNNDGLTPQTAKRTIGVARNLIRDRSADELLLKRGDVFYEAIRNWNLSGRSADEPILIGAYGDSPARPLLKTGGNTDGFSTPTLASATVPLVTHVVLQGIAFEANLRNTKGIDYVPDASGGQYGFRSLGTVDDFLIENCSFDSYTNNVVAQSYDAAGWGPVSNFTLRRSVIVDAYAETSTHAGANTNVRSEGAYFDGVQNLLIEENVFDHNGWNEQVAFSGANIYNHNIYIASSNNNVTVQGNVIANASSHGLQMRPGGIVRDNLFLKNPIAMSFGYVNGADPKPGGVTGQISGNVVIGAGNISDAPRGWGVELANISQANISNNIFSNWPTGGSAAIRLDATNNSSTYHAMEVGINNLTIENNKVYGWSRGISLSQYLFDGGTGYLALNNLVVRNNQFQNVGDSVVADHSNFFKPAYELWENNTYQLPSSKPFKYRPDQAGTAFTTTLANWKATIEPTAVAGTIPYYDPGRDTADYSASIGGAGTEAGFLQQARQQSQSAWRPAYTAGAVNSFVQAGYELSAPEPTPVSTTPVATLSADAITAAATTPQTLRLRYTSSAGIDLTTLGTGDLRVVGPKAFDAIATFASATPTDSTNQTVDVVYTLNAPAGGWSGNTSGTYQVYAVADQVAALDASTLPAGLVGTFQVQIDAVGPVTLAQRYDITGATSASGGYSFRVGYSDPSGVNVATIDNADLRIVRTSGTGSYTPYDVPAVVSSITTNTGTYVEVNYSFASPATGWKSAYNGGYDIVMQPNQVADQVGNFVAAGRIGSFTVAVETKPPTVSIAAVTSPRNTALDSLNITFSEAVDGVDVTDLALTRNGVAVALGGATLTTTNNTTYTLGGLSGLTAAAGSYVLTVKSSGTGIVDTAGNAMTSGATRSWSVDLTPPTVNIDPITPNPRVGGVASFGVHFSEAVTGFDAADLLLTRNGTTISLSGATITTTNNIDFVVSNVTTATATAGQYALTLQSGVQDTVGNALTTGDSESWQTYASVASRKIFYNHSYFDGNSAAANAADDGAVASDKTALLPGQKATFANYTSYSRGINGLMIDIMGLASTTLDPSLDFGFQVGNNNTPTGWAELTTQPTVTVRPGAGVNGSDRITLIWPDNAVQKQWLKVVVRATAATGLQADDVFYFGNAIGETGNSTTDAYVTTAIDEIGVRNHLRNPANRDLTATDPYDFNRDGLVTASGDGLLARNNATNPATALRLISVPTA